MLPTFEEDCRLIASLPDQFPSIQFSTLTAYTIGPFVAKVEGHSASSTTASPRPNSPSAVLISTC